MMPLLSPLLRMIMHILSKAHAHVRSYVCTYLAIHCQLLTLCIGCIILDQFLINQFSLPN